MKKWITFCIVFLFFFSLTEGKTPQKQNYPNIPVRKASVKPSSGQKALKNQNPAKKDKDMDCSIPIPMGADYFEGFEIDLTCWSAYNANGGDSYWSFSDSPPYVHSGTYSLIHSFGYKDQDDWVISPRYSLPAESVFELSFWSYNDYTGDYGKNSLLIARDNGNPEIDDFTEVWSPESVTDAWVETKIDLTDYVGDTIRIVFRYEGTDAHVWYIDDLSIREIFPFDAGVTAILKPVSGSLTASETLSINVKNFGSEALAGVPVKIAIDNGTLVSGIVPSIAVGAEVRYTFPETVNLSEVKSYTIQSWTEQNSDTKKANDTTTVTIINVGDCTVSTFPYTEGVENDRFFCWTYSYYDEDDSKTGWAVTNSVFHTGAHSVYHRDGPLGIPQDGWLISPEIQIPAGSYHFLSFWSYIADAAYYGKNSVWITDKVNPKITDYEKVWSPETILGSTWMEAKISLYKYAGKTIRIAFRYEGNYAHLWYLDDLKIDEITGANAGVTAISSPKNGSNLTKTETITVKVKNFGSQPLNNTSVFVQIDDKTPFFEVVPPIGIDEEIEFRFTATINLSEAKAYTIKAYTQYPNDIDNSNDTTAITVTNYGNIAVMGASASITSCDIKFVDDGLDGNYLNGVNETQTITFYPETPDKKVIAEFTAFASMPYEILDFWGTPIEYYGDTLFVYNGTAADENRLIATLTGHINSDLPAPFRSSDPDGSLTFVFKKQSALWESGWEANINCFSPQPYDAAVEQVLSPKKGGETAAKVKAKIANYGVNAITSTEVAYVLNDGDPVIETFTGNLTPGETAEFTFKQTINVSKKRDYTLRVYTLLPNDGDPANDAVSVSFSNITLFGYRIYEDTWTNLNKMGVVSFEPFDPSIVNEVSNYKDGTNIIGSGTYADDSIYVYSEDNNGRTNFIKLNSNWTEASKIETTGFPYDLTYDYSTGTLYAVSNTEADGALLQTVNPETGVSTTVAPITGVDYLFTLAADLAGNLYGVDDYGILVSINKTTGVAASIGSTGFNPLYLQSMTFDHNTGRLFWAMRDFYEGRLIELDPANGQVTDWGILGGNAQIVALYTIYDPATAVPQLIGVNIEDNATEVDPELSIIVTFDRNITASALSRITLMKNGIPAFSESVALTPSIAGHVLTIAHGKLEGETLYNLLIPAGTIDNYDAEIALSFTTKQHVALPASNVHPFSIFPNPAKDVVYVSPVTENSVISILDLAGRTLESQRAIPSDKDVKVDLNFAPGVYLIQIESNHAKVIRKLIIK
jgi:hypothetical protein